MFMKGVHYSTDKPQDLELENRALVGAHWQSTYPACEKVLVVLSNTINLTFNGDDIYFPSPSHRIIIIKTFKEKTL